MLNKDKIEEVDANLDAVKSERNMYIPRAIIKRLTSARWMPFGGRTIISNDGGSDEASSVLFYIILNKKHAIASAKGLE